MSSKYWLPAQLTQVIQEPQFTSLVLATPARSLTIFVEPGVGLAIQGLLTQQRLARPSTQDLMDNLTQALEIQLLRVLIYAVEQNVFKARMIWQQQRAGSLQTIVDLDCRPSDAIQMALRQEAPLWIAQEVVDQAPSCEEQT